MSTLAESFLHDLESDEEEEEPQVQVPAAGLAQEDAAQAAVDEDEECGDIDAMDMEAVKPDPLKQVAVLCGSRRLRDHLELLRNASSNNGSTDANGERHVDTMLACNKMIVEVDDEISAVFKFVRDLYSVRFPELERLVPSPLDYAKVVKHIQNKTDVQSVDLNGIVPPENVMSIAMTVTTTSSYPALPPDVMDTCLRACDVIIQLHDDKNEMLSFIESQMGMFAPNLTALIGSRCASRIIGIAGGLERLASIPACDITVLGHSRRVDLSGFSKATAGVHEGILKQCDLVARAPSHIRNKALKLVAAKVALTARIDCFQNDSTINDSKGREYREDISKHIRRLTEPDVKKQSKALPAPIETNKKRRGGRRFRKFKEKFEITELSKQKNRMAFGTEEAESYDGMELGMINAPGSGRVRLQTKDTQKLGKAVAQKNKFKSRFGGAGGTVSGFSTSLAFTPVQGLELVNPNAAEEQAAKLKAINEKYFSSAAGFKQVAPTPAPEPKQ
ncbi:unnamed protein product (mitochondrion) [Plasmodiophora brassicae]|uniref:Nop domain-containing protein n=1 Tax=Plasmodiophora brassicae TaxID=37360 RepID=A0A0G4IIH0_PLABS|nr:hypothetical protein PBRA_003776 [Plasmodiophora brassicae]SPQ94295.1 unnamed protein product [Plasmodiophora brassicae]